MTAFSFENLILKPLQKMLSDMLKWVLNILSSLSSDFFKLSVIQSILDLFQYVMYAMFILGVLFSLIDFITAYMDGENPSVFTIVKNVGKGLFTALFMQKVMQLGYEVIYNFAAILLKGTKNIDNLFSLTNLSRLFHFQSSETLIGLCITIFLIVVLLCLLFQLLERNGMFLLYQCTSVFYIIGICRGYESLFSQWLKQGFVICFINFVQILFFIVGLTFLKNEATLLIAVGMLVSSLRVEKIMRYLSVTERWQKKGESLVNGASDAFKQGVLTV